jgi:predicted MFS family arabinose efflux permease
MVMVASALMLAAWGAKGSLAALVAASVLLDVGVQASLVIGQRAIYSLSPDQRSRFNGIYIAVFFAGGALGSAMASLLFARGGGELVSGVALLFPLIALAIYANSWNDR